MFFIVTIVGTVLWVNMIIKRMRPVSLGAMFLALVVLMSVLIGVHLGSWYGYGVFLVYVGGLFVLFTYICSLNIRPEYKRKTRSALVVWGPLVLIYLNIDWSVGKHGSFGVHTASLPRHQVLATYNSGVRTFTGIF
jgi:NADH-ubiquinone oxidoreductase chain 6